MRPPFRVRKYQGGWGVWQRHGSVWRLMDTHSTQGAAVGDIYRRWPWWL